MRQLIPAVAVIGALALGGGLAACGGSSTTAVHTQPPVTKTVTPSTAPQANPPPANPAPTSPGPANPNVTDPWAVVSAYYADIESGNFQQAWPLVGSGSTTGQTYQQFVNGFACTGNQALEEISETSTTVTFDLAATNSCSGQVQQFSGTDTVVNGVITNANIQQTG